MTGPVYLPIMDGDLPMARPGSIEAFTPAEQRDEVMQAAGASVIGRSEEGRPIFGIALGTGPRHVSLISGNHSDEPVGSETLRLLVEHLASGPSPWLDRFTFHIVAHANPDGEAKQQPWIERWPDPLALWQNVYREPPGRDVEFGYPDMRSENRAAAEFLSGGAPYALHLSLHGMTVAEGAWHLIERSWVGRTQAFRRDYAAAIRSEGLGLFDWDRHGEKGFEYIEPGFNTTPRSAAMKQFFLAADDPATAAKFGLNSMEYVRSLGGDPLCMVTELPLFVVRAIGEQADARPGVPAAFLAFRDAARQAKSHLQSGDAAAALAAVSDFELTPVEIATAVRLQRRAIELGLRTVGDA